jgi:hypothetical protein
MSWGYFLKTKSKEEVCQAYEHFKALAEKEHEEKGYKIKRIRCDNGKGEFDNTGFRGLLKRDGIQYEPAPPYTQWMNGVSERSMRTTGEMARSMLAEALLYGKFWAEAISTSIYNRNRSPHRALKGRMTPYEAWYGKKLDISNLRPFGCAAYAHVHDGQRKGKFSSKTEPCLHLGYVNQTTKIWRLWSPRRKAIVTSADIVFNENRFPGIEDEMFYRI